MPLAACGKDPTNPRAKYEFYEAILNGETSSVKAWLEAGLSPNIPPIVSGECTTPLGQASYFGRAATVRALLDSGAEVNSIAGTEGNETPLSCASGSRVQHVDVVRALLEHGADPNTVDGDGRTPLMQAASSGHRDVVLALLDEHAEVDRTDPVGLTALMIASGAGRAEVVEILVQAGASKDVRSKTGMTAIVLAADGGHREVFDVLKRAGSAVSPTITVREIERQSGQSRLDDSVDCTDLSLTIRARNPDLNFVERAALVADARTAGVCVDGLREMRE